MLLLSALALPLHVAAQQPVAVPARQQPASLLDVPFVPQSEALCGGAAVAMVLRYWGEYGVYAEDFAPLVIDSGEGIRTTDLTAAVAARGWRATPFTALRADVRAQLDAGHPVIALIEDRPGVYHYVVIVAWGDAGVVFHDPARGPFRTMSDDDLARAWRPADHWALLILPADSAPMPAAAPDASVGHARAGADACDEAIAAAVAAARGDDFATAERALAAADAVCVDPHSVLTQRAGLRFREQRYEEAAELAARLARSSDDAYAWDLLASSRFMLGDRAGALAAWNRIGRPRNDLTRVDGLRRTPYRVAERAVGIPVGARIESAALARARRRLHALPTVLRARVEYRPIDGGSAQVDAAVVERPLLPSLPELVAIGARAALSSHARLHVTSPFGAGEVWRVEGVWQENREAVGAGVSLPGVLGIRAITSLRGGLNRSAFAGPDGDTVVRDEQRTVELGVSDWLAAWLGWRAALAVDDWEGRGRHVGAAAGLRLHALDGVTVWLDAGVRRPADGGNTLPYGSVVAVMHRDESASGLPVGWTLRAGLTAVDERAPYGMWSGAGTARLAGIGPVGAADESLPGGAWLGASGAGGLVAPLRAHALTDDHGVIRSRFWAPRTGFAGAELTRRIHSMGAVELGLVLFADAVTVRGGGVAGAGAGGRGAVDAGVGLVLGVAGTGAMMRIDAAWGVTDRASAITVSAGFPND